MALTKLAPLMLPPVPVPTVKLPVTLAVPAIFAPVPVTTTIFALPTAEILTFPFAAGILIFELPFAIVLTVIPVSADPLPTNPVAVIYPFARLAEKLAFD